LHPDIVENVWLRPSVRDVPVEGLAIVITGAIRAESNDVGEINLSGGVEEGQDY
jgi:hypothetical protein